MSPTLSSNSETIDRTRINERIKIHFFEMEMENLPTSRRRAFIIMNPIDAEFEFQIWKSNVLGWSRIPFVYRQYVANVWQIQHIATGYRTWKMFPHIFLCHSREQFGQSVSHVIHCGSITQTCMNVIKNRRYMKKKKFFLRTFVQQRIDVRFNHELPFSSALTKIHYVFDKVFHILYFSRHTFGDSFEQFYSFPVFFANVSYTNYVGDSLKGGNE